MIYGKRRVGKSELVLEFLKDKSSYIYYECLQTSIENNLHQLEIKIQNLFHNKYLHFKEFITFQTIGFISLSGFEQENSHYDLINGDMLYIE